MTKTMAGEAHELYPLTGAERCELLRLARESIRSAIEGSAAAPVLELPTEALLAPGGAFVTLRLDEELRGCIGALWPRDPLYRTVVRMAQASALEDPRFAPLQPAELAQVVIEISRLGPPRPAEPEGVDPTRHGLYVVRETARGLLLPQVALRFAWTREQFLAETCVKAGLPADAWHHPETALFVFEAEVFSEIG